MQWVALCVLITLAAAQTPVLAAAAPKAAAPKAASGPKITVRVARLDQLLPKLEAFVSQIQPGFTADVLRGLIGQALNDPTLANLDQTRSILIVVLDSKNAVTPAAVLPVKNEQYKTLFQGQGKYVYQAPNGKTLVVAQEEEGMVAARTMLPALEATMSQPAPSDLYVSVNIQDLVARFGPLLEQQMGMFQQMAGDENAGAAAQAAAQVKIMMGLAREIRELVVNANVTKEAVDLRTTLQATAGSALAKALDQPGAGQSNLLGFLPNTGAVVGLFALNADNVAPYASNVVVQYATAMSTQTMTADRQTKLRQWMDRSIRLQKGAAFEFLGDTASSGSLGGISVAEITDPKAYAEMLRNMQKDLQDTGLAAAYGKGGTNMKYTVKENARTVAGVPVTRVTQEMEIQNIEGMPPAFQTFMNMFTNISYEVAIVGNYAVTSMGSSRFEQTINAVKNKKPVSSAPLNAQALYKNGFLYMDFHPGRMVNWLLTSMGPMVAPYLEQMGPQVQKMVGNLRKLQTRPISMAVTSGGNGSASFNLNVPAEPIVKIKNLIMSSMMPEAAVAP
jgi:hypothetical protein